MLEHNKSGLTWDLLYVRVIRGLLIFQRGMRGTVR